MTIEEYMEKRTEELPDGYFFGVSENDRRIIAVRRPTTEDWLDDLDDRSIVMSIGITEIKGR